MSYEDALQDGVLLCKLMNVLAPGSINKINDRYACAIAHKLKLKNDFENYLNWNCFTLVQRCWSLQNLRESQQVLKMHS